MKLRYQLLASLLCGVLFCCCRKEEITAVNRPQTPAKLTVSKGDTSVFIKWEGVASAQSYLIVRGLKVIAENITTTSYEDQAAPDTAVEYRVYAVNAAGWRSYRYAFDTGYVAIPAGLLPRPPQVTATTNDYRYVTLTLAGGKFLTGVNIYRDGVLIGEKIQQQTFIDYNAGATASTYTVYGVNNNGLSATYSSATGNKAYLYNGSYEDKADGYILKPWTFVADNIGYYTEGDPVVTAGVGVNGSKALKITNGKAQLLFDWGGVPATGKYRISLMAKKSNGGFWMVPNFTGASHVSASGAWETFTVTTDVIQAGASFNLKVEPYGSDAALLDNWTIEYIKP